MKEVEAEFRCIERVLDDLLERDEERLRSAGLRHDDRSARIYHYKNDHLSWFHTFTKEWVVDVERARVTVGLYYGEPVQPQEAPKIELTWRAEQFRQGQESSIDKSGKATCAFRNVQEDGISAMVTKAVADGAECLPTAR